MHTSTDFPVLTLSAKDLQSSDPKRFQKEYSRWIEYALDYDWWDGVEDILKEDMAAKGIYVKHIHFSVSYSQSDYASFEAKVNMAEWMAHQKLDEMYPALYLALGDYGEHASVGYGHRGAWPLVNFDGHCVGNTVPAGVFQHLDNETWDALVEEQYAESGLEEALQSFVTDACHDLYRQLRDEYEYLTSEESFIESCECNDITFDIEESES